MRYLLDANVLTALTDTRHNHHQAAKRWFMQKNFAVCPTTEGALVRYQLRIGFRPRQIAQVIASLHNHPQGEFWADDLSYLGVFDGTNSPLLLGKTRGNMGYRQATDFYLAALANHHGGRLATFDRALYAHLPQWVELIPSEPETKQDRA